MRMKTLLCGAALLFASNYAQAQIDWLSMGQTYTQGMQMQQYATVSGMIGDTLIQSPQEQASTGIKLGNTLSSKQLMALVYDDNARAQSLMCQELAKRLVPNAASADAQQARQAIASGKVWKEFAGLLDSFNYSSRNLADITTAYYVIAWEVVNGEDATRHPRGIAAVRQKIAVALGNSPQITQLPDIKQQELGLVMGHMAALIGGAKNQLRDAGDQQALAQLRSQVRDMVLKQGLDLGSVDLTDDGFEPT